MRNSFCRVAGIALAAAMFTSTAGAVVLIPNFGDLNCDGNANVVDVQMAILSSLGLPVNPLLDGNANGNVDACEDYADAISGNCAEGQVIKWDGAVWACADDVVGATEPGPPGQPGSPGADGATGADGKTSLIEVAPGATECPHGGTLLYIGTDTDGNGAIAGTEISYTVPVCNGAPGAAGPAGIPGEPADPAALGQIQGDIANLLELTTSQAATINSLSSQVQDLQASITALQNQVAGINTLATSDLSTCPMGFSVVKTSSGWGCSPPADAGPGGLSQMTHYSINSACKTSSYSTASWTWADLYPEAQAAGEDLSQCVLTNRDQGEFRWNQNMECNGQGSTYELTIGNIGPNTQWDHGAASTGGKIGGIKAASYVESGMLLLCWK